MTQTNNITQPVHKSTLGKRMVLGAGIALVLIIIFLLGVDNANPAWGKLWMIRPLIIVPIAGAMGGLFYYLMAQVFNLAGWKRVVSIAVGVIGYIIALWLGTVLGLAGTLWN